MRALAVVLWLAVLSAAVPAQARAVDCTVSEPISAASLNQGGTWTYQVSGGVPNSTYAVKIQWAGDPSNGGHPSDFIEIDASGNGSNTHPGQWAADGFLPVVDSYATPLVFISGDFSVHVYVSAGARATGAKGTANCAGTVTEPAGVALRGA